MNNAQLQVLAGTRLRALLYTRLHAELWQEPLDQLALDHAARIIADQFMLWRAAYPDVPEFQDALLYNCSAKIGPNTGGTNKLMLIPTPEFQALLQGQARVQLMRA